MKREAALIITCTRIHAHAHSRTTMRTHCNVRLREHHASVLKRFTHAHAHAQTRAHTRITSLLEQSLILELANGIAPLLGVLQTVLAHTHTHTHTHAHTHTHMHNPDTPFFTFDENVNIFCCDFTLQFCSKYFLLLFFCSV